MRKQPKINAPLSAPEDILSATDFMSGRPSCRPSRRSMPTRKVRDNNKQQNKSEKNTDEEDRSEAVDKQLQTTLSQYCQKEAVIRRLGTLAVTKKTKKAKK